MPESRDDPTILDSDPLWRRIHPSWLVDDGKGGRRLSTAAFENSPDGTGTSVTLGRDAQIAGVTPRKILERFPERRLASVAAGVCRANKQILVRDPEPEDPHHALIDGEKPKSVRRALSNAASLIDG